MPATLEVTNQTNDLNYPEIKAIDLLPLRDFILVQWEYANPDIKVGDKILKRPDTHIKQHYSGIVIEVGDDVNPKIKTGMRIVFDQFSDPKKFWDQRYGRVALLQESMQGALFMIVPPRVTVGDGEPSYNFDA